jgi:hypothetical protein
VGWAWRGLGAWTGADSLRATRIPVWTMHGHDVERSRLISAINLRCLIDRIRGQFQPDRASLLLPELR